MPKISIKTQEEIAIMTEGGKKLHDIREQTAKAVRVGMTTEEVDAIADKLITRSGGEASFKLVPGYKHATCINVNDVVVHGIPGKLKILKGDKVGIDVGLYYKGFHTDTSTTVVVANPKIEHFLEVGRRGLRLAIEQAKPGHRIADISRAMQQTVEDAKFEVVRALTGHGIGRSLHEEPAIPCFELGAWDKSPKIVPGMVLAIEIMYNYGVSEVVYKNTDGWTISTADGKISGLFEETVAITARGPVVLT